MCQYHVPRVIQPVRDQRPHAKIIHYLDYILFAHPDSETVHKILVFLKNTVAMHGMLIAPDKIRHVSRWKYLGHVLKELLNHKN